VSHPEALPVIVLEAPLDQNLHTLLMACTMAVPPDGEELLVSERKLILELVGWMLLNAPCEAVFLIYSRALV
jgi:hypothetical protein